MTVNRDTTTRKLVSLPNAMVQAIADFRFRRRIGTESEAIRRLIELGLSTDPAISDKQAEMVERFQQQRGLRSREAAIALLLDIALEAATGSGRRFWDKSIVGTKPAAE